MPHAARKGDPIGHSPATSCFVNGLLVGAAVGVGAALVIGTGGLAAAAIVGGLAAGGAGVGELLSSMSWAPKEVCGMIISGAPDIFINNRPAARAHVDKTICSKHPGTPPIATGSATVIFNNMPAARVDDKISCGAVIVEGSPDVIIEGGTVQTDTIQPENLVPAWVHWSLLAVGIGAAVILGGPIVAALGLVGGIGCGMGCAWLGGRIFGQGSDGQKWMMLGGSLVGGMAGAKGGVWLKKNYTISTQGLGSNLGNIKIQSRNEHGNLIIESGEYSASELRAAEHMASLGKKVQLRQPVGTRADGGTSDLLIDGERYDVYSPKTGNPARIVSAIAKKNSQAEGIIVDLSDSPVKSDQLGNLLYRVQGAGATNIKYIIIIGG